MPSFYFSLQVGGFKLPFLTIGTIMMMLVLVLFLQQLSVASTLGRILLLVVCIVKLLPTYSIRLLAVCKYVGGRPGRFGHMWIHQV